MTITKYIILIRSFNLVPLKVTMKEFTEQLNKIKRFKNLKTFFTTGNIILDIENDDGEIKFDKKEINNEISNLLINKYNMDKPLMSIFNLEEYKDILSSNPYIDQPSTKIVIFFPINNKNIVQENFDKSIESNCKVINGVIYYFGVTSSKVSSDLKVFKIIDKFSKKNSNNECTFRTLNSAQKILDLANK